MTKPKGRRHYVVRWLDPGSGVIRQRSTSMTRRRDAQVIAEQIADEIFAGATGKQSNWRSFCKRYERERLAAKSPHTLAKWLTAERLLRRHIKPMTPRDVSANKLSKMMGNLTRDGMKATTLASHLRHMKAGLSFAKDIGLIPSVPNVQAPKKQRNKHMKGRPITGEEFDRMLDKIEGITGEEFAESWQHLMRGLWLSGLRLSEALDLSWDVDGHIQVSKIDSRRPMFLIPAEKEKGDQDRIHPMTPDFVEFLRTTPEDRRTGAVFCPCLVRGPTQTMKTVSKTICDIGELTKVVVDQGGAGRKTKYASAHDLRRSFGARWSTRVMPAVLQQLMRHASVETTMKYYVGQNAEQFADVIWEAAVTDDRDHLHDHDQNQDHAKSKNT